MQTYQSLPSTTTVIHTSHYLPTSLWGVQRMQLSNVPPFPKHSFHWYPTGIGSSPRTQSARRRCLSLSYKYIYIYSHCRLLFMKQVLPRFWRPHRPRLDRSVILLGGLILYLFAWSFKYLLLFATTKSSIRLFNLCKYSHASSYPYSNIPSHNTWSGSINKISDPILRWNKIRKCYWSLVPRCSFGSELVSEWFTLTYRRVLGWGYLGSL